MQVFPSRVFVQEFDGKLGPESKAVEDEMKSREIPVFRFSAEDIVFYGLKSLTKVDLVVGDSQCIKKALKDLKITLPEPPDYPKCLNYLLKRKIWKTTLGNIEKELKEMNEIDEVFVKPSNQSKLFSGLILNEDWLKYLLEEYPSNTPIFCSEKVQFLSEYRVYVIQGEIKGISNYQNSSNIEKPIPLEKKVVNNAVKLFSQKGYKGKVLDGYGIDFGVIKINEKYVTCLIEVNDGISLGFYKGISKKDYTNLLLIRWKQLCTT